MGARFHDLTFPAFLLLPTCNEYILYIYILYTTFLWEGRQEYLPYPLFTLNIPVMLSTLFQLLLQNNEFSDLFYVVIVLSRTSYSFALLLSAPHLNGMASVGRRNKTRFQHRWNEKQSWTLFATAKQLFLPSFVTRLQIYILLPALIYDN